MWNNSPQALTVALCILVFTFLGWAVADDPVLTSKCLALNGLSPYVITTMLQGLCAIFIKLPSQPYYKEVSMCESVVQSWGATCHVGFIKTLNDAFDRFYVGVIQTNTSGGAGDGWSWDDFNGMTEPATPLWATGQPDDTNNTESYAAYEAGNGLVNVNNNTFDATGFFCQCGYLNSTTPAPISTTTTNNPTTQTVPQTVTTTISPNAATTSPSITTTTSTIISTPVTVTTVATSTQAITTTMSAPATTTTATTSMSSSMMTTTSTTPAPTSTISTTVTSMITNTTSTTTSATNTLISTTLTPTTMSITSAPATTMKPNSTPTSTSSTSLPLTTTTSSIPITTTTTSIPITTTTTSLPMIMTTSSIPVTTTTTSIPITTTIPSLPITTTTTLLPETMTTSSLPITTTTTSLPITTTTTSTTVTLTPITRSATASSLTTSTTSKMSTSTSTLATATSTLTTSTTTTTSSPTPITTSATSTPTLPTTISTLPVKTSSAFPVTTASGSASWNASCVIQGVDPQSRVSTQASRPLGASSDCKAQCSGQTSFLCQAFIWAGPGTPCYLFGAVDVRVTLLKESKYYLTDQNCITPTLPNKVCQWTKTQSGVQGDKISTNSMKAFKAISQQNCETLCAMNLLQPKCGAYAFAPSIQFFTDNNCFILPPLQSSTTFLPGLFDVYQYNC